MRARSSIYQGSDAESAALHYFVDFSNLHPIYTFYQFHYQEPPAQCVTWDVWFRQYRYRRVWLYDNRPEGLLIFYTELPNNRFLMWAPNHV